MGTELTVRWSPPWAAHVEGRHSPRTLDADGLPEEQRVEATCTVCRATFRRACSSGMVRHWIEVFAKVHLHRSPLAPIPRPVKP
jgi:hypothetical protein